MSDYGDLQITSAHDKLRAELIVALPQTQPIPAAPGEARFWVPSYSFAWAADFLSYQGARLAQHTSLQDPSGALRVIATFDLGPQKGYISLETLLDAGRPAYPSLTPKIPAAHWAEREAQDLFGLQAEGHPSSSPLIIAGYHPHKRGGRPPKQFTLAPFEPVEDTGLLVREPIDPLQRGALGALTRDGEVLLRVEAQYFASHRGAEKQAEGASIEQAIAIAERLCISCCAANAFALCAALERIRDTLAPPRARALRVVALELERVIVHTQNTAKICEALSLYKGARLSKTIKERAHRLASSLFGHRFLMNLFTPGGLRRDITPDKQRAATAELHEMQQELKALIRAFDDAPEALERLSGLGVFRREDASQLGALGVIGRASGFDYDTRREHPYDGYRDLTTPQIYSSDEGDAAMRLKLRVLETQESLQLAATILAKDLPSGSTYQPIGPIQEGASAVGYVEAPNGENLTYVKVSHQDTIERYHVRSASYLNAVALPSAFVGATLEDAPLIEHSFGLCTGCIAR